MTFGCIMVTLAPDVAPISRWVISSYCHVCAAAHLVEFGRIRTAFAFVGATSSFTTSQLKAFGGTCSITRPRISN